VELVVFPVGTQTQLALVQRLNLPVAAAVLAVKMAQETVLLVGQAAAVDPLVVAQQPGAQHHRLGRAVLAAVLRLALFPAAAAELVRLERQEWSPLLVAVGTATLIR